MTDEPPRFGPPDGYEPPPAAPFTLYGNRLTDGEPWEATFSVLGEIPVAALADLSMSVAISEGKVVYQRDPMIRFLRAAIVPGDEHRFNAVLADKDRPIPLEQLGAVMLWAGGITTGRPTGLPPSSGPGEQDGSTSSEDEPPGPDDPAAG